MDKLEELRAFTMGMQSAFAAVVGTLMRTHSDPQALRKVLELARQREQAYLENNSYPERVLDSYQAMWKRFEVDIPPAPQSDPA